MKLNGNHRPAGGRSMYRCERVPPARFQMPPDREDDDAGADHFLALAEHYAAYWNDLEAVGLEPTDVGMWKVSHELAGGDSVIYHDTRDSIWKVTHADKAPHVIKFAMGSQPLRYAVRQGSLWDEGKHPRGGAKNKGQFAKKGQGGAGKGKAKKEPAKKEPAKKATPPAAAKPTERAATPKPAAKLKGKIIPSPEGDIFIGDTGAEPVLAPPPPPMSKEEIRAAQAEADAARAAVVKTDFFVGEPLAPPPQNMHGQKLNTDKRGWPKGTETWAEPAASGFAVPGLLEKDPRQLEAAVKKVLPKLQAKRDASKATPEQEKRTKAIVEQNTKTLTDKIVAVASAIGEVGAKGLDVGMKVGAIDVGGPAITAGSYVVKNTLRVIGGLGLYTLGTAVGGAAMLTIANAPFLLMIDEDFFDPFFDGAFKCYKEGTELFKKVGKFARDPSPERADACLPMDVCKKLAAEFYGKIAADCKAAGCAPQKPAKYARGNFVYKCPYCGGLAFAGDPVQGGVYIGYAICSRCGRAFNILGKQFERPMSYAAQVSTLKYLYNPQEARDEGGKWTKGKSPAGVTGGTAGPPRPAMGSGSYQRQIDDFNRGFLHALAKKPSEKKGTTHYTKGFQAGKARADASPAPLTYECGPKRLTYAARVRILKYAAMRIPKGYVVNKDGRVFRAGMWVSEQDLQSATPAPGKQDTPPHPKGPVAAHKEQAAYRHEQRRARGPVDREKLHAEKLAPHSHHVLSPHEQTRAKRTFAGLHQHHGELTAHRIEELANGVHEALKHVHPDDEMTRERLSRRMRGYHEMLHMHDKKGKEVAEKKAAMAPWEGGTIEKGRVYQVPTEHIIADPKRFQFKLNVNKEGVTEELKSVKKFDPELAGVVSVWRDPANGKTFVVNGHHRLELAKRTGHPALNVMYIDAPDEKAARARGALINIAEGRGTSIDAAKFMRDTGMTPDEMAAGGISLTGKVAGDAIPLTKLNNQVFQMVTDGVMPVDQAITIGQHVEDHELQSLLVNRLKKEQDKGRDISPRLMTEMARKVAESPKIKLGERGGQRGMFDDLEAEDSVFVEQCELQAHVRAELAKEVGLWKPISSERRAAKVTAGEAGNVLNVELNKQKAADAAIARGTFDRLANRSGLIADAINKGAVELARADTRQEKADVRARTTSAVRDAIQRETAAGGPESVAHEPGRTEGGDQGRAGGPQGDQEAPIPAAADAGGGGAGPPRVNPPEWKQTGKLIHPQNSLGIKRADLPQIRAEHVHEFLDGLRKEGISVEEGEIRVGDLKPAQAELNQDNMDRLDETKAAQSPIITSSDGYVLDGHHRWGKLLQIDPNKTMRQRKIGMPIRELIERAKAFDKAGSLGIEDMGKPLPIAGAAAKAPKPVGQHGHKIGTHNIHEYAGKVDTSKLAPHKANPWSAFEKTPAAKMVPLSKLISTKDELQDPKFLAGTKKDPRQTAADWMVKSIEAEPGAKKRAPLDVEDNGDGTFTIKDGNATAQAAMLAGWEHVPVHVAPKTPAAEKPYAEQIAEKRQPAAETARMPAAPATATQGPAAAKAAPEHKFFEPHEMALPEHATSHGIAPDAGYQGVLPKAHEAKSQLDHLLDLGKGIGARLGYRTLAMDPESEEFARELEKPGGIVVLAPVKGEKRAGQKVAADYDGDWSRIRDLARATVAVDTADDLKNVLTHLRASGVKFARKPKDKMNEPTEDGYRDLNLNVRMPNGMIAELQLHLKPILEAKRHTHPYYVKKAEVLNRVKLEKRALTPEETAFVDDMTKKQKDIFDVAWGKATGKKPPPESYHELVSKRRQEHVATPQEMAAEQAAAGGLYGERAEIPRGTKGSVLNTIAAKGVKGMTLPELQKALGERGQHAAEAIRQLDEAGKLEREGDRIRIKGAAAEAAKPRPTAKREAKALVPSSFAGDEGSYAAQVAKKREGAAKVPATKGKATKAAKESKAAKPKTELIKPEAGALTWAGQPELQKKVYGKVTEKPGPAERVPVAEPAGEPPSKQTMVDTIMGHAAKAFPPGKRANQAATDLIDVAAGNREGNEYEKQTLAKLFPGSTPAALPAPEAEPGSYHEQIAGFMKGGKQPPRQPGPIGKSAAPRRTGDDELSQNIRAAGDKLLAGQTQTTQAKRLAEAKPYAPLTEPGEGYKRTFQALIRQGFVKNNFPTTGRGGERLPKKEGWIRRNDQTGNWEGYTNEDAVNFLNKVKTPPSQSTEKIDREAVRAADKASLAELGDRLGGGPWTYEDQVKLARKAPAAAAAPAGDTLKGLYDRVGADLSLSHEDVDAEIDRQFKGKDRAAAEEMARELGIHVVPKSLKGIKEKVGAWIHERMAKADKGQVIAGMAGHEAKERASGRSPEPAAGDEGTYNREAWLRGENATAHKGISGFEKEPAGAGLTGSHKEDFDRMVPALERQMGQQTAAHRQAQVAGSMIYGEPPAVQKALVEHLQKIAPEAHAKLKDSHHVSLEHAFAEPAPPAAQKPMTPIAPMSEAAQQAAARRRAGAKKGAATQKANVEAKRAAAGAAGGGHDWSKPTSIIRDNIATSLADLREQLPKMSDQQFTAGVEKLLDTGKTAAFADSDPASNQFKETGGIITDGGAVTGLYQGAQITDDDLERAFSASAAAPPAAPAPERDYHLEAGRRMVAENNYKTIQDLDKDLKSARDYAGGLAFENAINDPQTLARSEGRVKALEEKRQEMAAAGFPTAPAKGRAEQRSYAAQVKAAQAKMKEGAGTAQKTAVDDALKALPSALHVNTPMQVEGWARNQWFNQSSAPKGFSDRHAFTKAVLDAWKAQKAGTPAAKPAGTFSEQIAAANAAQAPAPPVSLTGEGSYADQVKAARGGTPAARPMPTDKTVDDAARQIRNLLGAKGNIIAKGIEQAKTTKEKIHRLADLDTDYLDDVYNRAPGTIQHNEYFRQLDALYTDFERAKQDGFMSETPERLHSRIQNRKKLFARLADDLEKAGEDDLAYLYRDVGGDVIAAIERELPPAAKAKPSEMATVKPRRSEPHGPGQATILPSGNRYTGD